jgi:hypothetical protein
MAISYSGEGYKFNPQFANLGSLQGLQPLDVTRKAEFQLQPLAYAPIQSSRPELVSEGISKGILAAVSGITEGITAKYKEEKALEIEENKTKRAEAHDKAMLDRQMALLDAKERIKGSLPTKFIDTATSEEVVSGEGDATETKIEPVSTEGDVTKNDLPIDFVTPVSEMETNGPSLFRSLTPADSMQSGIAEQAKQLEGLSPKYATAGLYGGAIAPIEPVPQMSLEGLNVAAISPEQNAKAIQASKQLSETLAEIKPIKQEAPKSKRMVFTSAKAADEESKRSYEGWGEGSIPKKVNIIDSNGKPTGQVGYSVERQQIKPEILESKAAREEASQARQEAAKERLGISKQNTLNREQVNFQNHPDIKAFLAPNGMRQSIGKFVRDYDAIAKNPEASGISDIGLLDMFGRAEGGGKITEGQAALALRSVGIFDKPEQLIQKLEGGARLSQNQRDQMLRVIAEDHAAQANLANQQVQMKRNQLKKQGITDEEDLPQFFILPQTKWEAESELAQMKAESIALRDQMKIAETPHEKNKFKLKIETIYENAKALQRKIDKSKSAIINLHEMETTPQGWSGGASAILMQQ